RLPGAAGARHEPPARVVDPGQAGVAHERHPLPRTQPRQHLRLPRRLVVAVIAEQRPSADPVTAEQSRRVPRVLAQHDVGLRELGEHAQRDVVQVPDRRRADGERHAEASRSSYAISPAPIVPASAPSSASTMRVMSRPGSSASVATTALAGPSRSSPARPKPPPTAITSGTNTFTIVTMPSPRIRPI